MRNALFALGLCLGALAAGCGSDDDGGCPGVVCNNCATDCSVSCAVGQTEYCVSLSQFGGDPNLRCDYCQ
jgi:hypothetical protein